ncbi:MAG: hypothetical protein ACR2PL_09565 [Dehalococcoidia bacterium]
MDRSSRRIIDDDRLVGLWLRQSSADFVFSAPVRLPDDTLGLAQVELRTVAHHARRIIHWLLFARTGVIDSGDLDLPALAFWQALAHVERRLQEQGIWLHGRTQATE